MDPEKGGHARWIINDGSEGIFDAVIVTVGTCGVPQWVGFDGMPAGFIDKKKAEQRKEKKTTSDAPSNDNPTSTKESSSSLANEDAEEGKKETDHDVYRGPILHSSQLDSAEVSELDGKTVVVIGSGASGVEAVETALARGAGKCIMVARDDKVSSPVSFLYNE